MVIATTTQCHPTLLPTNYQASQNKLMQELYSLCKKGLPASGMLTGKQADMVNETLRSLPEQYPLRGVLCTAEGRMQCSIF